MSLQKRSLCHCTGDIAASGHLPARLGLVVAEFSDACQIESPAVSSRGGDFRYPTLQSRQVRSILSMCKYLTLHGHFNIFGFASLIDDEREEDST